MSYDATFESVDVPQEILALRDDRLKRRGGKKIDEVEFTFTKGRWGHLGEATLVNRVKSHVDVGKRWYPDILQGIREEQAAAKADSEVIAEPEVARSESQTNGVGFIDTAHAIQAH